MYGRIKSKKSRPSRFLALSISALILALCAGCWKTPNAKLVKQNNLTVNNGSPTPGKLSVAPAKFTDITKAAGINFKHFNSRTARKYLIEIMGAGAAFIDYDGDGWQDLLFINGSKLPGALEAAGATTMKLYRNHHDGTFTDETVSSGLDKVQIYGMGVTVGDYDNDGHEDFYVSCAIGGGRLFHNDGKGRFTDVTTTAGVANNGRWGTSCAWVDVDNDGKLDLFICNYVKYASLGDDQPCFADSGKKPIYCIPTAFYTSSCSLFHNEGNGKFRDISVSSGISEAKGKSLGIAVWDYDNDGLPDLFVSNDTVAGFLFHNLGNSRFKEVGVESNIAYDEEGKPHSGMGIDANDINNDGNMALAITNYQGVETSLYRLTSPGLFNDDHAKSGLSEETGRLLGFGVTFFDYDNDGYKDMLQANGHVQDDVETREKNVRYHQPTVLFHNQQNGTFEEVGLKSGAPFSKPIVGRSCLYGDVFNRGKLDIVMTENNGEAMLWKNDVETSNHWIVLKLVGTKSNRDGIGAMVLAKSGGRTQRFMTRCGSGYLSQSDMRTHFGLGKETAVDLEIHWPSGAIDRIAGAKCDQVYTAKEGDNKLEALLK